MAKYICGTQSYLSDACIKHYSSILSKKPSSTVETLLWFKKWEETKDDSYREKLILGHIRLVLHIINKYISKDPSIDLDDMFQNGLIALMKAVDTFDYHKGYKFSSYASKIISNETNMLFRKMQFFNMIMSLDQLIDSTNKDNTIKFEDRIKDPNADFEADVMHMTIVSLMESALDCLTEKQRNIIIDYFGLYGHTPLKQRDCAEKYGISQSYMCRIKQTALKKMKVYLLSKL